MSLDHDGEAFAHVGDRDPVIGALQRAHPGQRPVLFHSPYEAAAWSVISARRPPAQGAKVRAALSERLGRTFELAGRTLHAFPQPSALAQIPDDFPGPQRHQDRAAARRWRPPRPRGDLDVARIHELGPEAAFERTAAAAGDRPVLRVADRAAGVRLRRRVARRAGAARRRSHRQRTTGSATPTERPSGSPRSPTAGARFAPGARSSSRVAGERGTRRSLTLAGATITAPVSRGATRWVALLRARTRRRRPPRPGAARAPAGSHAASP